MLTCVCLHGLVFPWCDKIPVPPPTPPPSLFGRRDAYCTSDKLGCFEWGESGTYIVTIWPHLLMTVANVLFPVARIRARLF